MYHYGPIAWLDLKISITLTEPIPACVVENTENRKNYCLLFYGQEQLDMYLGIQHSERNAIAAERYRSNTCT